ncbi:MAG: PadR family transcriptional regulator [Acidimicrobiales bacterium]|nr:PadR family transcriptional regulator [Acidimicrobiales bacterium]
MPSRNRSNPLALAVLVTLHEKPMHPYEVATTLRQRHKHESVRLNYGSLYSVVASLEKRGMIAAQETEREGRLPERTIYRITDAGRTELRDWLTEMICEPTKEYPAFEAALSFLGALPPDTVVALLEQRELRLQLNVAQARASREVVEKMGLPRLFWVEGEFATLLVETELAYVRRLIKEIQDGTLEGVVWWRAVYQEDGSMGELPPFPFEGPGPTSTEETEQSEIGQ